MISVNINYLIGNQSNVVCDVYNLVGEKISSFKFSSNKGINNIGVVTNTFLREFIFSQ